MEGKGLAETLGIQTATIKVAGKTYTLAAPSIVQLYAAVEEHVRGLQPNPLVEAAKAEMELRRLRLPPDEEVLAREAIRETASRALNAAGTVSEEAMTRFELSAQGWAFKLWKCLEQHHAEDFPTLQSVIALVSQYREEGGSEELLQTELDRVTGEADAKNVSGPSPTEARETPGETPSDQT